MDTSNSIKYLLRCISVLQESIVEPGLLNYFIVDIRVVTHSLNAVFCGPGTELEKRSARGDKGINPTDRPYK